MIEDSFYRPRQGDSLSNSYNTFSSRLGSIDLPDERILRSKNPKYDSQVSIASSLGRVRGPEYPYKTRPTQPPTTTRRYQQKRPPMTQYEAEKRTDMDSMTSASSKYFKTNKNLYDPFSFQSTERSPAVEKYLEYKSPQNTIFSNRLDSRFSVPESSYTSSISRAKPNTPRPRPRSTRRPVVVSYEEALRARTKPVPSSTSTSVSSDHRRTHSTEPEDYAESRYYSDPRPSPSSSARAGYQGAINPVFVSLNEQENVEIRSRIPTPPPRNYFPVAGDSYHDDTDNSDDDYDFDDLRYTSIYNNRIDEIDSGYGTTYSSYGDIATATEPYNTDFTTNYDKYGYDNFDNYETTQPSENQQKYWNSQSYYNDDNIWEGYSKVVQDLLSDKEYGYPGRVL